VACRSIRGCTVRLPRPAVCASRLMSFLKPAAVDGVRVNRTYANADAPAHIGHTVDGDSACWMDDAPTRNYIRAMPNLEFTADKLRDSAQLARGSLVGLLILRRCATNSSLALSFCSATCVAFAAASGSD
jgi:hypothetical protein